MKKVKVIKKDEKPPPKSKEQRIKDIERTSKLLVKMIQELKEEKQWV